MISAAILKTVIALCAWLLLAVPAVAIVWGNRRDIDPEDDIDISTEP